MKLEWHVECSTGAALLFVFAVLILMVLIFVALLACDPLGKEGYKYNFLGGLFFLILLLVFFGWLFCFPVFFLLAFFIFVFWLPTRTYVGLRTCHQ